jgi:hypothetical protein
MPTATRTEKVTTDVTITLTLSQDEADMIRSILGEVVVIRDNDGHLWGMVEEVYDALKDAGAKTMRLTHGWADGEPTLGNWRESDSPNL